MLYLLFICWTFSQELKSLRKPLCKIQRYILRKVRPTLLYVFVFYNIKPRRYQTKTFFLSTTKVSLNPRLLTILTRFGIFLPLFINTPQVLMIKNLHEQQFVTKTNVRYLYIEWIFYILLLYFGGLLLKSKSIKWVVIKCWPRWWNEKIQK